MIRVVELPVTISHGHQIILIVANSRGLRQQSGDVVVIGRLRAARDYLIVAAAIDGVAYGCSLFQGIFNIITRGGLDAASNYPVVRASIDGVGYVCGLGQVAESKSV